MKQGVPYDMTNFFLNRNKSMFFINLLDVEKKKRKIYDIRRESFLSNVHSKQILKSLSYYKLITYHYDVTKSSYVIKFTKLGLEVREQVLEFKKLLEKVDIWTEKNGS